MALPTAPILTVVISALVLSGSTACHLFDPYRSVEVADAGVVSADDGPVTDGPVTDGPVTGGPVTDSPVTDGPVTDGPVTDGPVTDGPVTDGPVTDGPVTDGPVTDSAALVTLTVNAYNSAQPTFATIVSSPPGMTCYVDIPCSAPFIKGTLVTLTVTGPDIDVLRWKKDGSGCAGDQCSLTLSKDMMVDVEVVKY